MTNPHSGHPSGYSLNSSRNNHFSYVSIDPPRMRGSGSGIFTHPSRLPQLLSQDPDMTSDSAIDETEPYPVSNPYISPRGYEMANHPHFPTSNGASAYPAAGSAPARPTPLPSFSRAFELFTTPLLRDATPPDLEPFFIPSYLSDSDYARNLRDAHQAKVKAYRDSRTRDGQATAPLAVSSPANRGPHAKPPQQSESPSFDIIEKPTTHEDPSTVPPLPSRWSKTDKVASGIDVMHDGLEVLYNSQKQSNEYDAASIRSNHPIPPECGIYYFEVMIVHGKHDE